ncbi:MAG TPA: cation:proton antiporter [Bacteroidales bacterium]|nr:cation:proton antiporter [Bacteroidales bacterium]HQN17275.1 cation:proton antiporter [Bacteroidales bacterium]HQP16835.1 cation:proton antiporter [Bacteroidales bacterium]
MIETIIVLCVLILIAYFFDLTSSKTKIPSVLIFLLLGWIVRQITIFLRIQLPDFSFVLPIIGTIGLVLIVLDGSLELELKKSKIRLITSSFLGALLPMIVSALLIAYLFHFFGNYSLKDSMLNAIPFCIISSAIAIPSVKHLPSKIKEFVIYESSFSDIVGVIFFTFMALNDGFSMNAIGNFGLQILLMLLISIVATIALSFLLSKIQHHIKFIPIIILVVLIYAFSKLYHLPALIFILLFGLFIGNLDEFKHFKWSEKLKPEILDKEVRKFKELTIEVSFLVRALFFILFGYLIEASEILNTETLVWSLGIVILIYAARVIQLKLSKLSLTPLLFITPRGLITILLFISIEPSDRILLVNNSMIIQVIIFTTFLMMIGLMITPKNKTTQGSSLEIKNKMEL